MPPAAIDAYDRTRDFSGKAFRSACYAPFTNLYFDTAGDVRVCCHNPTHKVGNITASSIAEIWNGEKINQLRTALENYDLGLGCSFCKFQIAEGCYENLAMRKWDRFLLPSRDQIWPQQMEFSISNTCNLECIMCRGLWSSAIRARREKLPPLPKVYGDKFFNELRAFLPHLERARFLGGEPFLQEECFRIWDMMIEDGLKILCHATTNGTQFNSRVERILEQLPFDITVSMDGASKSMVEGIRKNLRHESYMDNCRRFRSHCETAKRSFSLTFCLMRQNWREFGDVCLLADDWNCSLWINTVLQPPEFGVYTLPRNELAEIVSALERQDGELQSKLKKNRNVWTGELERLRRKAAARDN